MIKKGLFFITFNIFPIRTRGFQTFERFISLSKKHTPSAPGACTKLPWRLKTNLRYETSPQSRPVVGNTKLGELYWVLSDNKTSLQDFAVREKKLDKAIGRSREMLLTIEGQILHEKISNC